MPEFNQEQHNEAVSRRYEQLARYAAFDALVDMALDGQITLVEAVTAYESDIAANLAILEGRDV